jgi:hypothetical protein
VAAIDSPVQGLREVDDGHGAYGWNEVRRHPARIVWPPVSLKFLPRPLAMAVGHAADGLAALTRKPGMVSAGKMRELYHADWVSRPPGWPRDRRHSLPKACAAHLPGPWRKACCRNCPLPIEAPHHDD